MTVKIWILNVCLIFSVVSTEAQFLFAKPRKAIETSYFINRQQDTIYGAIELPNSLFGRLLTKVNYSDGEGFDYKLKAHETERFSMKGDGFHGQSIDEMYYFLRPAVEGSPSLYYLEQSYAKHLKNNAGTSMAMMRMEEKKTYTVKSKRAYVDINGRMQKISRKRFKKQAMALFASYPEVVSRLNDNDLTWHDLDEIVDYCNYLNDATAALIEKKSMNNVTSMQPTP